MPPASDLPPADRIDLAPAVLRGLTWNALLASGGCGLLLGLLCALFTGAIWPPLAPAAILVLPMAWVWLLSGVLRRMSAGLPRRVAQRRMLLRLTRYRLLSALQPRVGAAPARYVPRNLPP